MRAMMLGLAVCLALSAPAQAASPRPVVGTGGMVVTESPEATLVGARVLQAGGNAIDAAVAVHFALAVTYPRAGNLGGGGFLIIRMADGTEEAIDFREIAPAAATRDLYLGEDGQPDPNLSTSTLLGTGVPGSVAGMGLAHERHATRSWEELLAPAIRLARGGFALDRYTAEHLAIYRGHLGRHPETARILLNGGELWSEGDTLRQPELAATLTRLARHGPAEFYEGATADSLVAEMTRGGGIITAEDLRGYRAKVRRPLRGGYRDLTILTMPPPSSGGIALLQMLHCLEDHPVGDMGPLSSDATHLLVEAMKRAFADRAEFLGDADFTPVPVDGLLRDAYLDSLCASIDPERATPSLEAGPGLPPGADIFYRATGGTPGPDILDPGPDGENTTHFSIVDAAGNAVAVTTTLNTSYGTGLMVTGAGFLLNNELDDFAALPGSANYYGLIQGEANSVRPFARPLSSMTPTIALRGDRLALVLGSPGGPKIITAVLQTLVNVVDHQLNIQQAIDLPRVHHQWWPDTLRIENDALSADTRRALEAKGHHLGGSWWMGSVQGIHIVEGRMYGAADSRRNGCAAGLSGSLIVGRSGWFQ